MSEYSMHFAKKLTDDAEFDTIFGGEEDDRLMSIALKEGDEVIDDKVKTDGVENGDAKIGSGDNIGSDLGPGHDTKGALAAKGDTSDEDIIASVAGETFKKGGQLNMGSSAGDTPKDGGAACIKTPDCARVAGDNSAAIDKSFAEAYEELMKEAYEDMPAGEEVEYDTPDDAAPADDYDNVPAASDDYTSDVENLVDALDGDDEEEDDYVAPPTPAPADEVPPTDQPYANQISAVVQGACGPTHESEENDPRDNSKVEDGTGPIGGGTGIGSDLGPNKDVNKPEDDTSDEDIIAAVAGETLNKGGQLNTGSDAGDKPEDGGAACIKTPDCARVAGDDSEAADDDFKESADFFNAIAGITEETEVPTPSQLAADDDKEAGSIDDDSLIKDAESDKDEGEAPTSLVDLLNDDDDDELMKLIDGE